MCGICGFTGKPENREDVIRRMTEVITHRGPDSEGYYSDDAISMGFRRLSIIDLEAGRQPIFNEDKTLVLTFNGEIYNYKALRKELTDKGHTFATQSDSEVLVHGFEEWHEDLLPRLRGMFGFAIYNTKDKSIFIARDFFGIKPMHYAMVGEDFVYASEIKSILEHPNYEKRFNKRALDTYLSFQYAVPPETFFVDIYCLLPGYYLWYKDGIIETTRYFEPRFRPKESMTEQEAVDKIERVFENSVNAHKIADVEVGCFLSSGVDSSYVSTYFADQKTFTVGFDFGEKYNEISWAETLSKLIGVEHHTHLISSEEFWDAVPTVQYYMDQPLADPSCVALYFVSRLASNYVKVVLSGEGADELFGGYTCYNDPRVFKLYQKIVPHFLRRALRAVAQKLPDIKGRDFVIRACDKLEERYIGNAYMYDLKQKQKLLKDPSIATSPSRHTRRHYYRCRRYDDVTKMQYLDINMWMTGDILLKADRMSMANSLELRVPFLDKEVFKVAATLPTSLRVNKENTKYAMRKAAARHLPETTAEKEKLGFPVPTRVWLKDEKYYNIVKAKFRSETAEKFFNTDALVNWLDEHFKGKEDNSRRVWTIYVFLVWYDIYFNEKNPHPEKPEEHLDELKAAAEAKRKQRAEAPVLEVKAAEAVSAPDSETTEPADGNKDARKPAGPEGAEKEEKSPEESADAAQETEATGETAEAAEAGVTEETAEAAEAVATGETAEAAEAGVTEATGEAAEAEAIEATGEAAVIEATGETGEAAVIEATDESDEAAEAEESEETAETDKEESVPVAPENSGDDDDILNLLTAKAPEEDVEPVPPDEFRDIINLFRSDDFEGDFYPFEDELPESEPDVPKAEEPAIETEVEEPVIEADVSEYEEPAIEAEAFEDEEPAVEAEASEYEEPVIEAEAPEAEDVSEELDEELEDFYGEAIEGLENPEEASEDIEPEMLEEEADTEIESFFDDGSEPAIIEDVDEVFNDDIPESYVNISNPDDDEIYDAPRKKPATHQEKMQMAIESIERRAKYLDEPNVISDEAINDIVSQINFYDEDENK